MKSIRLYPPSMIAISNENFLKIENSDALYLFLVITKLNQDLTHEGADYTDFSCEDLFLHGNLTKSKFLKALKYLSSINLNPFDENFHEV